MSFATKRGLLGALSLLPLLFFAFLVPAARADIQISPLEDPLNIPLSPREMRFELNDVGSSHIGPSLEKFDTFVSEKDAPPAVDHQVGKRAMYGSGLPYWYSQIKRKGTVAYGRNSSYVIWRNVRDYGAKGTGLVDDTDAINAAINDGNRCGYYSGGYPGGTTNFDGLYGCDSQTTTPAIVYFPAGTYLVSKAIVMLYYTQLVGDANNLPVLKAAHSFQDLGLLDADPYLVYQVQYYQNQNNFYRTVRNFVLDSTGCPPTQRVNLMHWQVAQATALQNIVFRMAQGTPGDGNQHVGIFMDNGSALYLEDLVFIGGQYGFYTGNQQFNIRNLTFIGCETGLYQNWNWGFTYVGLTFNGCGIGLDMTSGDPSPSTGSLVLQDSEFNNCPYGIVTSFAEKGDTFITAGTLILDNVNFANTPLAVTSTNNTLILAGNKRVASFVQGTHYAVYDGPNNYTNPARTCYGPQETHSRIQQTMVPPVRSPSLLDANGKVYGRKRPQYEGMSVDNVRSILNFTYTAGGYVGCPNDGVTDATACVQAFFNSITSTQLAFIDHGAYVITNTIQVPNNIKMVGEIWPLFMAYGSKFQDQLNPVPVFRVGQPGDIGTTEINEIVFETRGPAPGAIMMEWNLECTAPTTCGMFDTHWRIGGSNGTLMQNNNCKKRPNVQHGPNPGCMGAFLLVHLTATARNVIMSNNWLWVADHELDLDGKDQIDIYNGRGMLIESTGPVWLYGSSSEHSTLYNYQIANAANIYLAQIQSETAYMQSNPNSLSAFVPQTKWSDPAFAECFLQRCYKTIALRIFNSKFIYNYGAGLYSFFENYDSACLTTVSCDQRRVVIEQSEGIYMYAMTSVGAEYLFEVDGVLMAPQADNANTFGQTVGFFEYP